MGIWYHLPQSPEHHKLVKIVENTTSKDHITHDDRGQTRYIEKNIQKCFEKIFNVLTCRQHFTTI